MSVALSPVVSEFETEEKASSYDRWFRAKVQASRDDPRPQLNLMRARQLQWS